ncbi:S1/P1 nuclease [Thioalkalivibrio sp. XN279]|uniref:S1/P1 nuclease n=1 Tax=Thioalkalivibrio sp. XN279 TaxID=2714953 RepID=UPI00140E8982|nr:S1/P1 nuclease [Thioalkalivibrio sp. XN279]NHA14475.1 S1/P1 nuclease [Thioalkalivibrio sp. XN279]
MSWRPALCAGLLGLACLPSTAQAWGPSAHRIAAEVMDAFLCTAARAEVEAMTGHMPLAELVVWPDRIRDTAAWSHTRDWHYMNVADDTPVRADTQPESGRILAAIRDNLALLPPGEAGPERRRQALAFVLHLVVDLHQPLHVGRAADRGGNSVRVRFAERETNLHRLWDSGLLYSTGLRPEEHANALRALAAAGGANWAQGSLEDWADESRRLRPWVYDFDARREVPIISRRYAETGRQLASLRLAQASVRSARLLNGVWCPDQ